MWREEEMYMQQLRQWLGERVPQYEGQWNILPLSRGRYFVIPKPYPLVWGLCTIGSLVLAIPEAWAKEMEGDPTWNPIPNPLRSLPH